MDNTYERVLELQREAMDQANHGASITSDLTRSLAKALNTASAENGSNTPDFIIAEFLCDCLSALDKAIKRRDEWYGIAPSPGWKHGS